jgi:hypothetical protein
VLAEGRHYWPGLPFSPPARAVVRPFGWHTLNVPGEGVVCGPPYPELLNRRTGKHRGQVYVGPRIESGQGDDPSVTHPWRHPPPRPRFQRGPAGSTPGAGSCHDSCQAGLQARPDPRNPSPRSRPLVGALDPRPDPTPPTLQYTSPVPANLSSAQGATNPSSLASITRSTGFGEFNTN